MRSVAATNHMIGRIMKPFALIHLWLYAILLRSVVGWFPHAIDLSPKSQHRRKPFHNRRCQASALTLAKQRKQPILDAEFDRVNDKGRAESDHSVAASFSSKTLIDLSLEADATLKNTRVPFMIGDKYIDVRLAFMTDCDGVSYGIGVPYDHAAAITVENADGSINYVSPDDDDDDSEELMQIFAKQLHEQFGEDFQLRRTPKVLTISGPLEISVKDWVERVVPKPLEMDELIDGADENVEFFHNYMKEELGQEMYEQVMNDDSDLPQDFLELFSIPGLGDKEDDVEGLKELLSEDPELDVQKLNDLGGNFIQNSTALKLLSYMLPGKTYSLVQILKPYILVSRCISEGDGFRFELLSPEEEKVVIPRLEKICKDDLERLTKSEESGSFL